MSYRDQLRAALEQIAALEREHGSERRELAQARARLAALKRARVRRWVLSITAPLLAGAGLCAWLIHRDGAAPIALAAVITAESGRPGMTLERLDVRDVDNAGVVHLDHGGHIKLYLRTANNTCLRVEHLAGYGRQTQSTPCVAAKPPRCGVGEILRRAGGPDGGRSQVSYELGKWSVSAWQASQPRNATFDDDC